MLMEIVRAF